MRDASVTADRLRRLVFVLWAFVLLPAPTPAADGSLRDFLDAYCVSCHNAETKKGGLDLEKLSADFQEPAAFASWVKVYERVQAGEMPPKARPKRPDKAEAEAILKRLAIGLA